MDKKKLESRLTKGQEETKIKYRRLERARYDSEYFEKEYWKEDIPGLIGNRGLEYNDPGHTNRFGYVADLLLKHFRFGSFLDAGCGTGILVYSLVKRGVDSFGLDVSAAAFDDICEGIEDRLVVGGIEDIPFSDSCFDVVFCSDVLEHILVFDIENAINELVRVSRHLVISTINIDNIYSFHPTILSRLSWKALFELSGQVSHMSNEEELIQAECKEHHPEYDFFVYRKL